MFKRQRWVSTEPDEAPARYTIAVIRLHQLVFLTTTRTAIPDPRVRCTLFFRSSCRMRTGARSFGQPHVLLRPGQMT